MFVGTRERTDARCWGSRTARLAAACVAMAVLTCLLGNAGAAAALPHASLLATQSGCLMCHASNDVLLETPGDPGVLAAPVDPAVCVGCHVGGTVDAPKVYAGDAIHYYGQDGFGHNGASVTCLDCHVIHGPALGNPSLAGHILRVLEYQPEAAAACDPETAAHDRALSVWCTACHDRWPVLKSPIAGVEFYSVHNFEAAGGTSWRDCESCFDCHGAAGFPHYSVGADAGLMGAGSVSEALVPVADRGSDAVCLACHRNGTGDLAEGVGIDY